MDEKQQGQGERERIDLNDKAACERWVKKLNVTQQQMREAVEAVGDDPSAVELHLKGVRSTSNEERVEQAMRQDAGAAGKPGGSTSDKPR